LKTKSHDDCSHDHNIDAEDFLVQDYSESKNDYDGLCVDDNCTSDDCYPAHVNKVETPKSNKYGWLDFIWLCGILIGILWLGAKFRGH